MSVVKLPVYVHLLLQGDSLSIFEVVPEGLDWSYNVADNGIGSQTNSKNDVDSHGSYEGPPDVIPKIETFHKVCEQVGVVDADKNS